MAKFIDVYTEGFFGRPFILVKVKEDEIKDGLNKYVYYRFDFEGLDKIHPSYIEVFEKKYGVNLLQLKKQLKKKFIRQRKFKRVKDILKFWN